MYRASLMLPGHIGFPFIGGSYKFWNKTDIVLAVSNIVRNRKTPFAFLLGSRFVIYITDPNDAEIVINHPNSMDKGGVYKFIEEMIGGPGLFSAGGDYWKMHRRLLNPTVQNTKILNSFYPCMNECLKVLVDKLKMKDPNEIFNIYEFIETCTFDMFGKNTFGVDLNVQNNENMHVLQWFNDACAVVGKKIFLPHYQFKSIIKLTKYYKMWQTSTAGLRSFIRNILRQRIAELSQIDQSHKKTDEYEKRLRIFLDEIVQLSLDKNWFSEEEMISESLTMLLAGYETSAVTISNIIVMLAMHPEYQEMVYQEIRAICPDNDTPVTADELNQLYYTERFIKETMRHTPTVPLTTRQAKADLYVGKVYVPAGTEIIISQYDMQRNKKIWGDDAETFNPDHFLPERIENLHPYAFLPFSNGTRNCIGKKFSLIVIRMFVVWLVRNFKFSTDMTSADLVYKWLIVMKLSNGYLVKLEKREAK